MTVARIAHTLRTYDVVSLFFLLFLTLLNLIFHTRIGEWWLIVLGNTTVSVLIVVLALKCSALPRRNVFRFVREWYPVALVVYTFQIIYYMIYPIRMRDYDAILIQIDRWIFGVNPTEWIAQFHHPVITEFLQIIYATFYFLFLIVGYELYRKNMQREFHYFVLLVVYGFYLSYIGYFLVPAIGPRFTLHDFHLKNEEMPGLVLTDLIRELLNRGESIPPGVPNPEDYVHRDVFPSGHTQLTLVLMYVVCVYRMRSRTFIYIIGTLLIFSTVYLWYHYVIDLIAAVGFWMVTIATAPLIERWWQRRRRWVTGENKIVGISPK